MERVLHQFITALRGSGCRVSISETMDAMNAVELIGYQDREILKHALSTTLAKADHEKAIFDACFERYFSADEFTDSISADLRPEEIQPDTLDSPLTMMLLSGDQTGLSMAMRDAAQDVDIGGIRFFTQKGLYAQRILKGMGLEDLDRDIKRIRSDTREASFQKATYLAEAKERLFSTVRDFIEQQFSLFSSAATEELMEKYLRHMRLSNLEQQDYHRMDEIIRKMVKSFNDRFSRRRRAAKRDGALDFKKSLRENIAHQGMIFDIYFKKKKIERPDIIAICDVSRSVEATARFMLLLLYSLNEAVARIRSFILCANLVEVTDVFDTYPVEETLVRLQKGTGLDIIFGRTDYGQALMDFKDGWLDIVTRKTTVLILGDARNNYGDPRTEILRTIHDRCRRLIWLNPEPPPFWNTGDSEMKRYRPYCSFVQNCSTVNHLERIVGFLLRSPV